MANQIAAVVIAVDNDAAAEGQSPEDRRQAQRMIEALLFASAEPLSADELAAHVTDALRPALVSLRERFASVAWDRETIATAIKETLAAHQLKMPQIAPALRVLVCGRAQTPSIDAVLALFTRERVLARMSPV